ncbi:hypothetical protein [Streptomyces sp. NPDC005732]|uniref:hypothetical protein n=1 Tax=Streptomyces sp. NPDC005732 TaxID=3157057 RepID=UPI0033CC13F5
MQQPTDDLATGQTPDTTDALEPAGPSPCRCGSVDHDAVRIGDQLSPDGKVVGAVYVCQSLSAAGLLGAL